MGEVFSTSTNLSLVIDRFFSFELVSRSRQRVDLEVTTVPSEDTPDSGLVIVVVEAEAGDMTSLRILLGDLFFARFEGDSDLSDAFFFLVPARLELVGDLSDASAEWREFLSFCVDTSRLDALGFIFFLCVNADFLRSWRFGVMSSPPLLLISRVVVRRSDAEALEELRFPDDGDFFFPRDLELEDILLGEDVFEDRRFPRSRDEPLFTASLLSSESKKDIVEVKVTTMLMTTD